MRYCFGLVISPPDGAGLGLSNGAFGVAQYVLLADLYGLRSLGQLTGLNSSMGLLGMGVGPLLLTLLHDASGGYQLPLLTLAAGMLPTALLLACAPYTRLVHPSDNEMEPAVGAEQLQEEGTRLLGGGDGDCGGGEEEHDESEVEKNGRRTEEEEEEGKEGEEEAVSTRTGSRRV